MTTYESPKKRFVKEAQVGRGTYAGAFLRSPARCMQLIPQRRLRRFVIQSIEPCVG
jgi:hypothetical protein